MLGGERQCPFCGKNNRTIVTLQARIPFLIIVIHFFRKRVLPFTSGCGKKQKIRASLTIEASFSLSLFVFASVCLMLPMKMMDTQRQIQTVLETTCEDISRLAYIKEITQEEGEKQLNGKEEWGKEYLDYFMGQAAEGYLSFRILKQVGGNKIDKISFSGTEVLADGEHIDLVVKYRMRFPFPVFRLDGISMTSRSYKRAWIGKPGTEAEGNGNQEENDVTVYVGKSMGRFHWFRDCHYLFNHISQVAYSEIGQLRNQQGGKYYPCSVCGKGADKGGSVYIMPNGTSYHSSEFCSSIVSYVKAVPLSSVEYLGACSYCEKRKGN